MGDWWPTVVALTFGALSIPISYCYTLISESLSPAAMLILAGGIMTGILGLTFLLTNGRVKNKMYYGFALFVFSGVIDILSGLEMDGIIQGFLTIYLKYGEPYLVSPWGVMASYWDGTVNLLCYLTMAYLSSNGFSFRTIGLHWSSGILNSMIVLLLGASLSQSGMSWCTVLNIPYVLFPLAVSVYCLREPSSIKPQQHQKQSWIHWIDMALILLLIEAALAALFKGLAAIQCDQAIPAWYRTMAEPILQQEEPAPFAAIQGLITLFYFLPAYIAIAWGISINPDQKWLQDLTVILAGATLQAGGCTFGMVFHHLTKPEHQLPPVVNHTALCAFWAVNLLLCLVPQIVAMRLLWLPVESVPISNTKHGKSRNISNRKKTSKKIKEQ